MCSISLCSWKEHCHVIYRESKKFAEEYFQAQISNSRPHILLKHKSTIFFLIHRAAPNTQSFHQIRKKKIGLHFNFDLPKWTLSQSGVLSRKGSYFETWCPANLWGCQTDCYMPSCLNPLLKNAWHVLLPPLYSL